LAKNQLTDFWRSDWARQEGIEESSVPVIDEPLLNVASEPVTPYYYPPSGESAKGLKAFLKSYALN